MKFLCDEMLKRLARWLRVAGYDAAMEADGATDRRLIARARMENRILLTRDRALLQIRDAPQVVLLLEGNDLESCARELKRKLDIDWLYRPFSRCLLCNTPLVEIARPADVPPDVTTTYRCPVCDKHYWHGGHVERMRQRLEGWQSALFQN